MLPQIQEHMITAKCMGVEVKKSSSCILCKRKLDDSQLQKETIKCQNCHITILSENKAGMPTSFASE